MTYPPDLEQLSDDDLDARCQGCRSGEIVRFKRLVMEITARTQLNARQAAGTSSSTTMPSTETATKAAPKVIYEDTDPVQGGGTDTDPEVAVVNKIYPNPKAAVRAAVRIQPQGPAGPTTRREAYEARREAYEPGREAYEVRREAARREAYEAGREASDVASVAAAAATPEAAQPDKKTAKVDVPVAARSDAKETATATLTAAQTHETAALAAAARKEAITLLHRVSASLEVALAERTG